MAPLPSDAGLHQRLPEGVQLVQPKSHQDSEL